MMFPDIIHHHAPPSLHLQPPLHHHHPPPKYHLLPPESHHLPPVIKQKTPPVFVFNISAENREFFINQAKKYEAEEVPGYLHLPPVNKQKKNIDSPVFVFNISADNREFFINQVKKYEEEEAPSYGKNLQTCPTTVHDAITVHSLVQQPPQTIFIPHRTSAMVPSQPVAHNKFSPSKTSLLSQSLHFQADKGSEVVRPLPPQYQGDSSTLLIPPSCAFEGSHTPVPQSQSFHNENTDFFFNLLSKNQASNLINAQHLHVLGNINGGIPRPQSPQNSLSVCTQQNHLLPTGLPAFSAHSIVSEKVQLPSTVSDFSVAAAAQSSMTAVVQQYTLPITSTNIPHIVPQVTALAQGSRPDISSQPPLFCSNTSQSPATLPTLSVDNSFS